jgi:hypothetical protein
MLVNNQRLTGHLPFSIQTIALKLLKHPLCCQYLEIAYTYNVTKAVLDSQLTISKSIALSSVLYEYDTISNINGKI